jgi:hypothetical protein
LGLNANGITQKVFIPSALVKLNIEAAFNIKELVMLDVIETMTRKLHDFDIHFCFDILFIFVEVDGTITETDVGEIFFFNLHVTPH